MNWLDVFIVLFVLAAAIRGIETGFIRQFFSTSGFFLGLFVGAWANSKLLHLAHAPDSRAFITVSVLLASALTCMALGEYLGWLVKFKISETQWANKLDRFFGSILAIVALLGAIWLGAAIFRNAPSLGWQREIRSSRIISSLENVLPSAPALLTKVGHLLDPNGFPQVFAGMEPEPLKDAPLPDMGELTAAVQAAQTSVVKIEGRGCGGVVEGTGFVASSNQVITNAHVVAGVRDPLVVDKNGAHRVTVVWFDPSLDIAVLRTSNLAGTPLRLQSEVAADGTAGAVLGYPGGGDFNAGAAAVLDSFTATGRNIYNQGLTERDVYSIKADVQEGNSGGPLINKDGAVIGVVFARSTTYDKVGYALTMQNVLADLAQATHNNRPQSTGNCAE